MIGGEGGGGEGEGPHVYYHHHQMRHGPDGSGLKVSKICRISNLRRKVKICQEKEK